MTEDPHEYNAAKDIRVVLGQFGALVGRGLIELLREDQSFRLIGRDLDNPALERVLAEQKPEIVILDEASVIDSLLLRRLLRAQPEIGIVVIAHLPSRAYAARLLAAGATCLSKDSSAANIRATVHLAAEGWMPGTWSEIVSLTPRQAEILRHMRAGQSYPTIAHAVGLSVETVRAHAAQVLRKLGVSRKSELIGLQSSSKRVTDVE